MNSNLNVFVYGTLKPGGANFDRYCGSKVIASYRAYIDGDLYRFPSLGYPGAIHGNRQVHGFVLCFDDTKILPELDKLEEYDPHRQPAENDYTRELVTTYPLVGVASPLEHRTAAILAWAYFINPDRVRQCGGILVPDGWWEELPLAEEGGGTIRFGSAPHPPILVE